MLSREIPTLNRWSIMHIEFCSWRADSTEKAVCVAGVFACGLTRAYQVVLQVPRSVPRLRGYFRLTVTYWHIKYQIIYHHWGDVPWRGEHLPQSQTAHQTGHMGPTKHRQWHEHPCEQYNQARSSKQSNLNELEVKGVSVGTQLANI